MAAINDLIAQIENPELRARIQAELDRMNKQKKFGLVFEEHLPESVKLFDMPVKKGELVTEKKGGKSVYKVLSVNDGVAECMETSSQESKTFRVADLVVIAQFGTPIYPYLKPVDSICNAPDSDLWHTLIEADNYHALQLLEYLYASKVDCIYIDPPYNTGARDWKYNNDYVDGTDEYRHSKWLSFMQRRLALAKKLLNPKDSVLIVTIDEKEYLHLGCLLEQMFPEARNQMVSSVINPAGVSRAGEFSRQNEYIFIIQLGNSSPQALPLGDDWIGNIKSRKRKFSLRWNTLMRSGTNAQRQDRPKLFYPIFVDVTTKQIHKVGEPIPINSNRNVILPLPNTKVIWPIRQNGSEGNWQLEPEYLKALIEKGYVRLGEKFNERGTISIEYLKKGEIAKVESGNVFTVNGLDEKGVISVDDSSYRPIFVPGNQWNISSHDATQLGTKILNSIIGSGRFTFPKSLYATHDTIRFFVANKPNALILDFFAGSGTTLHAVNLLNAEDGGHRRCIMVTNNEVSAEEAKNLTEKGFQPGDDEWENLGIARYVTWPRTVCSIEGHDVNGNPLKGDYISDQDIPMSDGFKTNAIFFKLGFLNKNTVKLGRQFRELLPVLWMKAGAVGRCPELKADVLPNWLILPENKMAVLVDDNQYHAFKEEMEKVVGLETLYIITDFEREYTVMAEELGIPNTFQLYRDYLDNFRINHSR